jgi:hypothetical protein
MPTVETPEKRAAFYTLLLEKESQWEEYHFRLNMLGWSNKTAARIAALTDPEWEGNYDQTMFLLAIRAEQANATGCGSSVPGFLPIYSTFNYCGERYTNVCTRVGFTPWSFLDDVLHYNKKEILEFFGELGDVWRIPPKTINASLVAAGKCQAGTRCY